MSEMKESKSQKKQDQSQKNKEKQPELDGTLKTQIMSNLIEQSEQSHRHQKISSSQKNQQKFEQNQSSQNLSARQQTESSREFVNEFIVAEQENKKMLVNQYFSGLNTHIRQNKADSIAKIYSSIIEDSVEDSLNNGILRVSKHQEDIKNLLVQFKISSDELKILEKKTEAELRNHKILLLDPFRQFRTQKSKQKSPKNSNDSLQKVQVSNFIANTILTKEQHKKLIEKFKLSNKTNQRKKQSLMFERQERERSLSYQKQKAQQQKIQRQKQLKKLSIQQKLQKRKQTHESFILQEKFSTQKYRSMKKKKFLYQNMEEKFKSEVLIPSLEEKKVKLKQIRDFNKKYDIEEIKKHEQEYLQKKSQQSSKHNSRYKLSTFHYIPPQKSKKLVELLEEQTSKAKIKFQEKKRLANQNRLKQINFLSDVKIKFKPKIDENKREEIQKRLQSQQAQKEKPAQKDPKILGMRYFEEARQVFKRKIEKQKTQTNGLSTGQQSSRKQKPRGKQKTQGNDFTQKQEYENEFVRIQPPHNKSNTTRPQKRVNISFSQNSNHRVNLHESRRKQIRKIINSNELQREVKLERLKIQNEKINEIYKRRERFFQQNQDDQKTRQEAVQLLLNSIQAKMGIIDLCTKG